MTMEALFLIDARDIGHDLKSASLIGRQKSKAFKIT